ncbi:MAG: HisA/HisF-related TIM barrel protein, partial [Acidimicrobiales bacterium]
MELFPAIDLIGGRSVRLTQGDFGQVSDYGDPLEVARGFVAAGVGWVHIVDLDAARSGVAHNLEVIEAVAALGTRVQCGGGVRTALDAQRLFDVGVHRLVLGTAAIENPDLLASLARTFPGRIAAGLDHRHIDTGAP